MQQPRTALLSHSQRYSPGDDYTYETSSQHHQHHHHQEVVQTTRQPLGESSGNVQTHHNLASSLALCQPSHMSLSPPIHSIPTPPIVPTQALPSTYGTSFRSGRSLHRDVSLRESPMGYPRGSKNPIYAYKHFADYRNKVMQKELEKEAPIWPLWLEDAFLDALLLIPQMGRKKFSSKTVLYGRNMLITEYLWIYHWLLNPPQNGERIPDRKTRERTKHAAFRTRKQVSSHIQVLKGFFHTLVTFHFIFPSKKDGKDDDKIIKKEDEDMESFKNNRVLIAIADGRLPDERPNYEYFARLLNADQDVFLRPKQCRVFVSSSEVVLKDDVLTSEDGTVRRQVIGQTLDGNRLSEKDYPHLKLNEGKDYKDLPATNGRNSVLLHEYTKALSQKESSSIKDISNRWEVRFPELREKLLTAMDETHHTDELSSRCVVGPCDTFHFEVVLDLHANSKFPDGSELNGLVELSIAQRELHGHRWRSTTSVVKPDELHINNSEPECWDRTNPVDVIVSHRNGCSMRPHCDCAARGSRDTIRVPFPAASWANTFIKLAPFVNAEREKRERGEVATFTSSRGPGRSDSEDGGAAGASKSKKGAMQSPKELLDQIAMYQEIWSAPTDENNLMRGSGNKSDGWRRRAVILWTFIPVHDQADDKGKSVTVPAGTSWRFLTKFDPTSQYHQQHAYLSGAPNVSRDAVMSPNPSYPHHLTAAMQENLAAAYDTGHHMTLSQQHLSGNSGAGQMNMSLMDGFPNGLATPPPTAGLSANSHGYQHGYETTAVQGHLGGSDAALQHHMSFMSDGVTGAAGIAVHTPITTTDTDPFLLGVSVGSSGTESYDDAVLVSGVDDSGLHSWASSQGLDTSHWGTHNAWADAAPVQSLPTSSAYEHSLDLGPLSSSSSSRAGQQQQRSIMHPHADLFAAASSHNKNMLHHQQMPFSASSLHQRRQYHHQHQHQQDQSHDAWPASWTSPVLPDPTSATNSTSHHHHAPTTPTTTTGLEHSSASAAAHEDFALSLAALRAATPGGGGVGGSLMSRKRGRSSDTEEEHDDLRERTSVMRNKTSHPQAALCAMRRQHQHQQHQQHQQHRHQQFHTMVAGTGAPTPDMGDESFSFDV
ncbi:DNA-binding transcription factor-like protein [Microdochium nivale]|nr:DNA-binding transcription factor-like protein [Microdochium nivale]